ncbi:GNAT family N-acetyltransferase [uncultured Fusobacterium sp.]|mgnify:FL=1|uniref:GNAT family N-acetyltransferase n=1 Tax=uncultured Fusobacterium sp. TaxID=159267 RepID=UPI002806205E|nr:GNAT family N-acetyltransferase [uncultured Fusobacterium sp.]
MKIVLGSEKNVEEFIKLRMELFKELGEIKEKDNIEELIWETKQYYLQHIKKDLYCWFIEIEEKVVAVASMCTFCRIPYYENPVGVEGYILNVYTSLNSRKKGLATKLVKEIIEFSKNNSIKRLWLNSSEAGKNIYKTLGFIEKDNEMEYFI